MEEAGGRQVDDPSRMQRRQEQEREKRQGALTTLLTGIIIAAVILVFLFFYRSCSSGRAQLAGSGGGGIIQTDDRLKNVDGAVAVWLKPGYRLADVLERHKLADASVTSFKDGTYLLAVGDRDVRELVAQLKKDPALYDAGYVYASEAASGEAPAKPAESVGVTATGP